MTPGSLSAISLATRLNAWSRETRPSHRCQTTCTRNPKIHPKGGRLSSTHPPDPRESDKLQESGQPPEKAERGDASTAASQEGALSLEIEYRSSSPFPHPALLGQYKAIDPGLLNDVREMAVRQQQHQHEMDRRRLDTASQSEARGAYVSLIAVLGTLGLAGVLIATGNTLAGLAPLVVSVSFLVRVLFSGLRRRSGEQRTESTSASDT